MKTYSKSEIESFLLAIDSHLTKKFKLIIIGGTAAALAYGAQDYTKDIDTATRINAIQKAYEAAKKDTGLDIPMEPVGVADFPYDYEDRLQNYSIEGMKYLIVQVPEKHDLVLMKMIRGQENDLNAAEQIHENEGLSAETLLTRILKELTHVTGDKKRIKDQFLAMFEVLYDEDTLSSAERALKGWERS